MRRLLLVVALLGVAACEEQPPSISESFCADLRAGATPVQLYMAVKDDYTPEKFADRAYGWAAISCAEQLESNEMLREHLTAWGIDPDA